jgi:preprotein translocase subunit SecA
MASFLSKLFSQNQSASFVKAAQGVVQSAQSFAKEFEEMSQEEIKVRLQAVKERAQGIPTQEKDIAEVFALVRETARRVLGERHYDVQLIGGLALSRGKIAEMRTGEGKTLVATLPATLMALSGKGVHMVTVNDYLARRDSAWMGQVYAYLGLTVGVVTSGEAYLYDGTHTNTQEDISRDESGSFKVSYEYLRPASKREAYAADITFATNNELGFDYLRDNTAYEANQIVQRGQHYAIIDEIDSILIDEARTPLIISGPAGDAEMLYERFSTIVDTFIPQTDYTIDEKQRAIQITEEGLQKAEQALGIDNLYTEGGMKFAHHLETAVRAKALFQKDKEYVIQGNGPEAEIIIVDEFTGRLQPGRRWSEGLHQAVEAKEGVLIQKETRTYASVTFQNYFRMYGALCGMTGTGLSSEEEFYTVYKLDVVVIPTHRTIARIDHNDYIFQNNNGKYTALTNEIKRLQEKGQPVLVGTVSIEDNEIVSAYLQKAGIPHEVLNAKNHEREGELIAGAGALGAVTVATNLAGRGVDIKLGGIPFSKDSYEKVRSVGGLVVLGTERHEARRIDNQLRGRSGRQGDPGETRFYVSLEDKLMRVFASDMLKRVMGTFKIPEEEPIASSMISKSLETAQKRIEGFNFDSRKQVLAYDDVLNTQRLSVYTRRAIALSGLDEEIETYMDSLYDKYAEVKELYTKKENEYGQKVWYALIRRCILQVTDAYWLEHLETMEYLRRSVSLRAYGQRDPLIEYRREGLIRFQEMLASIDAKVLESVPHLALADDSRIKAEEARVRAELIAASLESGEEYKKQPIVKSGIEYGRNDMVTIRKGNEKQTVKFKKVAGLLSQGWTLDSVVEL